MNEHYQVLIVGGGTAGITVAAHLMNHPNPPQVAIIEPSTKHYYQPLWTLVGGGIISKEASVKDEAGLIPQGTKWIQDSVEGFDPDNKKVTTKKGNTIDYDMLVVAAGIQLDWDAIPGLKETVGKPGTGVCSNYSYETTTSTWDAIRSFTGGTAIFTEPATPIKCGGAPQKIMYLAEERFRKSNVRAKTTVVFANAKTSIFSAPYYGETLLKIIAERDIQVNFGHNLKEIHPEKREAVFQTSGNGSDVEMKYNMLHVTPPMSAPDVIKTSKLANVDGWVDVDKYTLQHARYSDVFGLGDCSSLPTSKTGAAIRKQAKVVVENLLATTEKRVPATVYDGYTSCPLVTGYGKLILAEFDYDKRPCETFPFSQNQERYSMYALKAYALPRIYWHGMLKGRL